MVDYIPELSNEVEFVLGDVNENSRKDRQLFWLVSFFKPNITVEANFLGLYLKRMVGDTNLDLRANILVYDPYWWTAEPEASGSSIPGTVTLASNVDLGSILYGSTGWKSIPINPFVFEADHLYTLMLEIISNPFIENEQEDGFIISAAQKFDIPMDPPDWPGIQRQAKSAYGRENLEFGWVSTYPVAVAVYGEEPPTPPPEKKFPYWILLLGIPLLILPFMKKKKI